MQSTSSHLNMPRTDPEGLDIDRWSVLMGCSLFVFPSHTKFHFVLWVSKTAYCNVFP